MNITGGKLNSRIIKVPSQENIKPTLSKVRQGIFNSLSSLTEFEGKEFLDMFSGSGIMAFEAFSRGFKITSFEKDKLTYQAIKQNAKNLGVDGTFLFGDSIKLLSKQDKTFDIIYIDPPYNSDLYEKSLETIKTTNCLSENGIIILEKIKGKTIEIKEFSCLKVKEYADKEIIFLKF